MRALKCCTCTTLKKKMKYSHCLMSELLSYVIHLFIMCMQDMGHIFALFHSTLHVGLGIFFFLRKVHTITIPPNHFTPKKMFFFYYLTSHLQ